MKECACNQLNDELSPSESSNVGECASIQSPSGPQATVFLCATLVLAYTASFTLGQSDDLRRNCEAGLITTVAVFCLYTAIHLPDGPLKRPAPFLWRLVTAITLLYFLILLFLLFQNVGTVRRVMEVIDPATSTRLEKSYAENCRIYDAAASPTDPWHNFKDKWDVFVLAHFFGWLAKAMILRDWGLLCVCSVLFEVSEQIFKHMLPNFAECWWDSTIMDVLGCNLLGILTGLWACRYLDLKKYTYGRLAVDCEGSPRPSFRSLQGWVSDKHSFRAMCWIAFFVNLFDLNYFFLKAILNLEPSHWLCVARTFILTAAVTPGIAEVELFFANHRKLVMASDELRHEGFILPRVVRAKIGRLRANQKLATHGWLCLAILLTELLLITRWARDGLPHYNAKMGAKAKVLIMLVVCATGAGYWKSKQMGRRIKSHACWHSSPISR